MSKVQEIRLVEVYADDWAGMYANGELIAEGHSLRLCDMIEWLSNKGPVHIVSYDCRPANGSWLCDRGRLPVKLADVSYDEDWSIPSDE
jgi:hypothetical protein